MFSFFESRVGNISTPAEASSTGPPPGRPAFCWHSMRQTRGRYAAMLMTGLGVALIDTLMPVFLGHLVGLMAVADPALALRQQAPVLLGIALVLLVGRPLMIMLDSMVRNNGVIPGVTTLIRWQSHWHMVRQSGPFFRTTSPGGWRTGSCRPPMRCARAWWHRRARHAPTVAATGRALRALVAAPVGWLSARRSGGGRGGRRGGTTRKWSRPEWARWATRVGRGGGVAGEHILKCEAVSPHRLVERRIQWPALGLGNLGLQYEPPGPGNRRSSAEMAPVVWAA